MSLLMAIMVQWCVKGSEASSTTYILGSVLSTRWLGIGVVIYVADMML